MSVLRVRLIVVLGLVSFAAILFAHLALTDIYHGELDTSLEWAMLQICFAIFITFHIVVFGHLFTIYKRLTNLSADG